MTKGSSCLLWKCLSILPRESIIETLLLILFQMESGTTLLKWITAWSLLGLLAQIKSVVSVQTLIMERMWFRFSVIIEIAQQTLHPGSGPYSLNLLCGDQGHWSIAPSGRMSLALGKTEVGHVPNHRHCTLLKSFILSCWLDSQFSPNSFDLQ